MGQGGSGGFQGGMFWSQFTMEASAASSWRWPVAAWWKDAVEGTSDDNQVHLRNRSGEGPARDEQVMMAGRALCRGEHASSGTPRDCPCDARGPLPVRGSPC